MSEHRFHTPEPVELVVKIPAGNVEVTTVDGDESVITLEGNEKLLDRMTVEQVGRKLVVEMSGKKHGITIEIGDFIWGSNSGRIKVTATVPHSSAAELSTAAADMRLTGSFGALRTKSAAGDLVVAGDIDDDVGVSTVSGDVHLQNVGGELEVKSVSGDVYARSVGRSAALKSVSGDVRLDAVHEGTITVQSVSGDIEIGVAAGTNLDVDAGSVSGDLSSEVPLGSEPTEHGHGPTVVVRGKTVSGDFRVFRAA